MEWQNKSRKGVPYFILIETHNENYNKPHQYTPHTAAIILLLPAALSCDILEA